MLGIGSAALYSIGLMCYGIYSSPFEESKRAACVVAVKQCYKVTKSLESCSNEITESKIKQVCRECFEASELSVAPKTEGKGQG